jgi:hypothetical protein
LRETEVHGLVVHGGDDEWTKKYNQFHTHYDFVIGVSSDSIFRVDHSKKLVIPSWVPNKKCLFNISSPCEKTILYMGRLSKEKRPEIFCEVIDKLPDNYCGWIIGSTILNYTFKCSKRSHIEPFTQYPECYYEKSYRLFIPSLTEGGPIVAIEAWKSNLTVVSYNTGLMRTMNLKINIIPEDDVVLASKVIENSVDFIPDLGEFSLEQIRDKWLTIKYTHSMAINYEFIGGTSEKRGVSYDFVCYEYCILTLLDTESILIIWHQSAAANFIIQNDTTTIIQTQKLNYLSSHFPWQIRARYSKFSVINDNVNL